MVLVCVHTDMIWWPARGGQKLVLGSLDKTRLCVTKGEINEYIVTVLYIFAQCTLYAIRREDTRDSSC